MEPTFYQQGDVILEQVSEVPTGAKPVEPKARGYVLAEGEVTGHAHCVEPIAGMVFEEKDGMFYLKSGESDFTVTHEEHGHITVPKGTWRVRIVKEYDHFSEEARKVAD